MKRQRGITPHSQCAFSLVEVLIVAVIIGVLAALVVPQFSSAADSQQSQRLRETLRQFRSAILVYQAQHQGRTPGYPQGDPAAEPTLAAMVQQLTQPTDKLGQALPNTAPQAQFGPYMDQLPTNPVNGLSSVRILKPDQPLPRSPQGLTGWIYQPQTGTLIANLAGNDESGKPYAHY